MAEEFGDPLDAPADVGQLGAAADRLLKDPVLGLAFEHVERDLIGSWRNSAPIEHGKRDEAYNMIWALSQIKARLLMFLTKRNMILTEAARKELETKRHQERRDRLI